MQHMSKFKTLRSVSHVINIIRGTLFKENLELILFYFEMAKRLQLVTSAVAFLLRPNW